MLSVIIKDNGEPNVIKLTYENMFKELRSVPDSEIIVSEDWLKGLSRVTNSYVTFVEADCLVSSGYFSSQLGLIKKDKFMRKLAMLTTAVGVNNWANRVYGYTMGNNYMDGIIPVKMQKAKIIYPVQIGFVPGAVIRVSMLKEALSTLEFSNVKDMNLVRLSTELSLAFWRQGDGNRVHINPNTTYVTTEEYVNDVAAIGVKPGNLAAMFKKESI